MKDSHCHAKPSLEKTRPFLLNRDHFYSFPKKGGNREKRCYFQEPFILNFALVWTCNLCPNDSTSVFSIFTDIFTKYHSRLPSMSRDCPTNVAGASEAVGCIDSHSDENDAAVDLKVLEYSPASLPKFEEEAKCWENAHYDIFAVLHTVVSMTLDPIAVGAELRNWCCAKKVQNGISFTHFSQQPPLVSLIQQQTSNGESNGQSVNAHHEDDRCNWKREHFDCSQVIIIGIRFNIYGSKNCACCRISMCTVVTSYDFTAPIVSINNWK